MKLGDLIARIRIDINDRDEDRFESEILVDYVNEALDELYQLSPSIFQKTVVAKLSEGDFQQPCCCDKLYSVDAITDAHGNKISEIRQSDGSATIAFNKKNCVSKSLDAKPSSYTLVPNSENQFTVEPQVRPGQEVYARLTCAIRPCELPFDLEAELPWYVSAKYSSIIDYVVYRALGTEHESQTSRAISEARRRAFLENLGYVQTVDGRYKKPLEK